MGVVRIPKDNPTLGAKVGLGEVLNRLDHLTRILDSHNIPADMIGAFGYILLGVGLIQQIESQVEHADLAKAMFLRQVEEFWDAAVEVDENYEFQGLFPFLAVTGYLRVAKKNPGEIEAQLRDKLEEWFRMTHPGSQIIKRERERPEEEEVEEEPAKKTRGRKKAAAKKTTKAAAAPAPPLAKPKVVH